FGGLPYVDAMHGDAFYITMLLRFIFSIGKVMALVFVLHIIVAGAGMLLYLKELKLKTATAFLGAMAYMFTGVIVSYVLAGHDSKVVVTSLLPWAMFFIHRGFRLGKLLDFALLGFVFGLGLISPNVQMMYYAFLICGFYVLYQMYLAYKDHKKAKPVLKPFLLSAGSAAVGIAISAAQMLPGISYLGFSPRAGGGRGWDFATSWSLPRTELIDLFNPRFSGILQNYWGANAFKQHAEYFGIIIVALLIVGLILAWRRRETKFFAGFGIFGLLMALGGNTPFYYIPYYVLPLVKSFRAPAMIFFTVTFSIIVIASLGLEQTLSPDPRIERKKGKKRDTLTIVFAVLAGLVFILALWSTAAPQGFGNFAEALAKGGLIKAQGGARAGALLSRMRANITNASGGFWLAFLFLAAGWLMIFLWRRLPKLKWLWTLGLGAVLFLDLWLVDRHFVKIVRDQAGNPVSAQQLYVPDEVVSFLKRDPGVYRVFPLQFRGQDLYRRDSYLMLHRIQSLGGYHGNQLARYQEFIGSPGTIMFRDAQNLRYPAFLAALDVKYLIGLRLPGPEDFERLSPQDQQTLYAIYSDLAPWLDTTTSSFRPVFAGQRYVIYRNTAPHYRAWLATEVEVIADDEAILQRMKRPDFDPHRTVILEEEPQDWQGSVDPSDTTSPGQVQITRYEPNVIELTADVKRPAVLVLSENWYPYYRAWVDGVERKVYRADYTLRAVTLEPGRHEVVFRFRSPYVTAGAWITIVALGLVGLAVVLSLVAARKKKSQTVRSG
ncbi:MAG: hypothetical protein U9Q76_00165, partial [candidate division WOR-3 bacterium]|nr:hypothetical protein [candidate division WOR-3 bacterium]